MMAVMLTFWKKKRRWVRTISAAILATGAVLHNCATAEEMQKLQELTVQAPLSAPFTLKLQGPDHTQRLTPSGKPYILHLWATWCGPCRLELPKLSHFIQAHPDLPVVPVAVESGAPERVAAFTQRLSLQGLPIWVGEQSAIQSALSHLKDTGLPMTVLVDSQGRIRAVSDGGIAWDSPDSQQSLQQLLREAK